MTSNSKRTSSVKRKPAPVPVPNDLLKLQGAWKITALEADGEHNQPEVFSGSQIVIKNKKFISIGMGAVYEGRLELYPSKKPKAFNLVFTAGPEKGNPHPGIYKLDGNSWTICFATRDNQRPNKFATKAGTGVVLETLERADSTKHSKQSAGAHSKESQAGNGGSKRGTDAIQLEPLAGGTATQLEGEWTMASGVFSGKPLEETMVKFCKRVTRGNVTAVYAGPQVFLKAKFTLDDSKDPHNLDYVNLQGASAGKSQAGIYELSGATLKICMSAPGGPRPRDFSSKPGDDRTYTTWRLTKK